MKTVLATMRKSLVVMAAVCAVTRWLGAVPGQAEVDLVELGGQPLTISGSLRALGSMELVHAGQREQRPGQ
jgi:hypothetical protein